MILIRALYLSEQYMKMLKQKDSNSCITAAVTTGQSLKKQTENKKNNRHSRTHFMPSPSMNEALFCDERKRPI